MIGKVGQVHLLPAWTLFGLFFFSVNNSRYISVGYGHHGKSDAEKLMSAARIGCLIAVASGVGALLWSFVFDHFQSHKVGVVLVQAAAVASAFSAVHVSSVETHVNWKVSTLLVVSLFTSMGICPIRDALASKQVIEAERRGIPTPSFGAYRMFLAVGQGAIALTSVSAMTMGDTGVLVVKSTYMLATLMLYTICFPEATVRFLLQTSGFHPLGSSLSTSMPMVKVSLLFVACLCIGCANSFIEMLFYPVLGLRGVELPMLGVAHCVALVAEVPMLYHERWWVSRIGSYAKGCFWACLAMALRLLLIAGLVTNDVQPGWFLTVSVFVCESLHGVSRVPATVCAARLAAELAPPGQVTMLSALFSMAIGSFGQALGLGMFMLMGANVKATLQLNVVLSLISAVLVRLFDTMHQPRDHELAALPTEEEALCGCTDLESFSLGDCMRVGLVHYSFFPVVGGVEKVMKDHAMLLAMHGYSVKVVAGRAEPPGPRVSVVEIPELLASHRRTAEAQAEVLNGRRDQPAAFLSLLQDLRRKLRAVLRDCDVVLVHNMMTMHFNLAASLALTATAQELTGTRFVAWTHDLAALNPNYPVHALSSVWPWYCQVRPQANFRYVAIHQKVQRDVRQVLNIASDCPVIENGIFPMQWLQVTETIECYLWSVGFLDKDLVLFNPCRVVRRKNLEYCIRMTHELRCLGHKVLFLVTGACDPHNKAGQDYRLELDALVQECGLQDCFKFVADGCDCTDSDVLALYSVADALCMASSDEGFGLPVLESSLLRLPVFCPSESPMASIVMGNTHTFDLCAEPKKSAEMVVRVLQVSPPYRARREVMAKYSYENIFQEKFLPLLEPHCYLGGGGNTADNVQYDVVVGLPSLDEEENIGRVVQAVDEGCRKYLPGRRCLLVNADCKSRDRTKDAFLGTVTVANKQHICTETHGEGKGAALLLVFQRMAKLRAPLGFCVDTDLKTISPEWVRSFAAALQEGYDMVLPRYARHRCDGTITNLIAYPVVASLFSVDVRQPIGGDFGFSLRAVEAYLSEWTPSANKYGVDIFMTATAVRQRLKLVEVELPPKIHSPSLPKLVDMAEQVVGSLLKEIKKSRATLAESLDRPIFVPELVEWGYGSMEPIPDIVVDPEELIVKAKECMHMHSATIFARLPAHLALQLRAASERGAMCQDEFVKLFFWALQKYLNGDEKDGAMAVRVIQIGYLLRAASHIAQVQGLTNEQAEALVKEFVNLFSKESKVVFASDTGDTAVPSTSFVD